MRVLIISGDDDSVCGTRGTELWLTRMGCVLGGGGIVGWGRGGESVGADFAFVVGVRSPNYI